MERLIKRQKDSRNGVEAYACWCGLNFCVCLGTGPGDYSISSSIISNYNRTTGKAKVGK